MILTTMESIPGREVKEIIGIASTGTVRTRHMGSDFAAGLKSMVGGRLGGYEKLMQEGRDEALERLKVVAAKHGADAVMNVRLQSAEIMQGASEVMAYGTAVKLK